MVGISKFVDTPHTTALSEKRQIRILISALPGKTQIIEWLKFYSLIWQFVGANGVSSAQIGFDSLSAHLECPVTSDLRFHAYSKGERGASGEQTMS